MFFFTRSAAGVALMLLFAELASAQYGVGNGIPYSGFNANRFPSSSMSQRGFSSPMHRPGDFGMNRPAGVSGDPVVDAILQNHGVGQPTRSGANPMYPWNPTYSSGFGTRVNTRHFAPPSFHQVEFQPYRTMYSSPLNRPTVYGVPGYGSIQPAERQVGISITGDPVVDAILQQHGVGQPTRSGANPVYPWNPTLSSGFGTRVNTLHFSPQSFHQVEDRPQASNLPVSTRNAAAVVIPPLPRRVLIDEHSPNPKFLIAAIVSVLVIVLRICLALSRK
jgi:hypothetical protein